MSLISYYKYNLILDIIKSFPNFEEIYYQESADYLNRRLYITILGRDITFEIRNTFTSIGTTLKFFKLSVQMLDYEETEFEDLLLYLPLEIKFELIFNLDKIK